MKRITRRESALLWNMQAPLDMEARPVPAKRKVDPAAPKEWKLQAACIKAVRARMQYDKSLRYEVNLIEGNRTPARAAMAKVMGMQRGPNDLTLYRNVPDTNRGYEAMMQRTLRIEFKLHAGHLTAEQLDWFAFHSAGGIRCERVDNLKDFLRLLDGF